MLNRRILRIKAFKAIYTSSLTKGTDAPMSLQQTENLLELSCEATRDLYLFMLGLVSPLTALAKSRIDAVQKKRVLTDEEKNPNLKFARNSLAVLFDNDKEFQKIYKKKNFSWTQYDIIIKRILDSVVTKKYYADYMASEVSSLAEDCKLFTRIFEEEIVDCQGIDEILEDMSIYWNDDLAYALTWCCHTFSDLASGAEWSLPELYLSDYNARKGAIVESDKAFVTKLIRAGFGAYDRIFAKIAEATKAWDSDRLVQTDVCLIVLGIAENEAFPNIPAKVTMNEYVEISKYYGSPKSSVFVNGLLNRLIENKL